MPFLHASVLLQRVGIKKELLNFAGYSLVASLLLYFVLAEFILKSERHESC